MRQRVMRVHNKAKTPKEETKEQKHRKNQKGEKETSSNQEEKNDAAAALAEATETAQSHTDAYNDRAATLSAAASTIEQEIRHLDVRHVELSAGVDEAALTLYRRTRGRRGIRIAAVKRGACGGCHTPFPPQTLSEIRHATTVCTCVNCGCITIWDEAAS